MEKYQSKKPKKKDYRVYHLEKNILSIISTYLLLQQKKNKPKEKKFIEVYIESQQISILIQQVNEEQETNLEERLEEQESLEEITLEEIALNDKNKIIEFPYNPEGHYTKNKYSRTKIYPINNNHGITDQSSGASVRYVSPSQLPSGPGWKALGMYDPSTHTIYIANNLPPHIESFVYHHEVAHAKGIRNESQADAYASSRVGYNIRAA